MKLTISPHALHLSLCLFFLPVFTVFAARSCWVSVGLPLILSKEPSPFLQLWLEKNSEMK